MSIFSFLFPKKEESFPVASVEEDEQTTITLVEDSISGEHSKLYSTLWTPPVTDFEWGATSSTPVSKECSKCFTRKSISCFSRRGDGKGLASACKDCRAKQGRDARAKNPKKKEVLIPSAYLNYSSSTIQKKKKCGTCQKVKTLDLFHKNASRKDGIQSSCKYCVALKYKNRVKSDDKQVKPTLTDQSHLLDAYLAPFHFELTTPTKTRLELFLEEKPSPEEQLQDILTDLDILTDRVAKLQAIITQLRTSSDKTR